MRNLFISIAFGGVVFAALFFTHLLNMGESILPAIFGFIAAYYMLARRTFKQVEQIFSQSAQHMQVAPPRWDQAIKLMESAYVLSSHQIGVRTQIDSQIGVLHFLRQEFKTAAPFLERATGFGHWMGTAMLAVIHYKQKNHDSLKRVIPIVCKRGKKHSLAWGLSAYLLAQIGDREAAQKLLSDGIEKTKGDSKLKDALLALQNGKKIKMKAYKEQWYQFHLERPPAQYQQGPIRQKVSKSMRRGRW